MSGISNNSYQPMALISINRLHCSDNMLLPRPGCATGTALAGTVHTLRGISYQGLVAQGPLLAEWRLEARASLATRRPWPAAVFPTALY